MKNIFKIVFLFIFTQTVYAQKFDSRLVSDTKELNFLETEMRGISSDGIIYFVEKDLKRVSAYKDGKQMWQTNMVSVCGKPSAGKPEIRHIILKEDKLLITYGKHSFAEVDVVSGKAALIGLD